MRRRAADKREVQSDPQFNSPLVGKFISMIMLAGKKTLATKVVYDCFELLKERTSEDPVKAFYKALDNARPRMIVKSRRIGGATYQVPTEVTKEKGYLIAMRWFRDAARSKRGKPIHFKLAEELTNAYKGEGAIIKKRDDTHKMAEANKAFAHFR